MTLTFHHFANPTRALRVANAVLPFSLGIMAALLGWGLWLALYASPPDYQQGEAVRIMYVHVPAAWMALFIYVIVAAGSISFLIWRHPLGELIAEAAAPIGACFTALALVTGSLWGQPMWGTWWVWDARLTSVLILFFLYLGYMALRNAFDDPVKGGRAASLLAIIGTINLPIIKFSVDWWNTLHQPASVLRLGGPTIHPDMLWPLLIMAAGFKFYFLSVGIIRLRNQVALRRLQTLSLLAANPSSFTPTTSMRLSSVAPFFAMGGYALYVWPAYGMTFAVLTILFATSVAALRRHETAVRQLTRTQSAP